MVRIMKVAGLLVLFLLCFVVASSSVVVFACSDDIGDDFDEEDLFSEEDECEDDRYDDYDDECLIIPRFQQTLLSHYSC
jgi:hypothetical protein